MACFDANLQSDEAAWPTQARRFDSYSERLTSSDRFIRTVALMISAPLTSKDYFAAFA